ncbi:MAG: GNAT family N-acetyltransferase [Acidimicrobiia bacterium]|jgi:GNAT superfamily N-acetyltransferase
MADSTVTIRRIHPEDGPRLREVRLRALRHDPGAFESEQAQEERHGPETWTTWAAAASTGDDQAVFVADGGDAFAAMVGVFREADDPRTLHVVGLWVEPGRRRRGIARRLLGAVLAWAESVDADTIHLWVADEANAARSLSREAGFVATDTVVPVASRPGRTKRRMVRALARAGERVPPGYVELAPVTGAEFDAYVTGAAASLTADLMEAGGADLAAASLEAERRLAGRLPLREATPGHHVCTVRVGLADEVAGWVWFSSAVRDGATVCLLHDLVVFEPLRGRGVGAATLDEVEEWARTQEHDAVVVDVFPHRGRARRFLHRLGYEDVGEAVDGRITMVKRLGRR